MKQRKTQRIIESSIPEEYKSTDEMEEVEDESEGNEDIKKFDDNYFFDLLSDENFFCKFVFLLL